MKLSRRHWFTLLAGAAIAPRLKPGSGPMGVISLPARAEPVLATVVHIDGRCLHFTRIDMEALADAIVPHIPKHRCGRTYERGNT